MFILISIYKFVNKIWLFLSTSVRKSLNDIKAEQLAQRELLEQILNSVNLPAVKINFLNILEGDIIEKDNIEMTNSQQATASITPVDKKGQPAPVDGIPVWASSDETIVTVTPAVDGMSAVVAAVGPLGSANVSVTADADLGTGVSSIFGTLAVSVTQGQAVGLTITLGPATEQGSGVPVAPNVP